MERYTRRIYVRVTDTDLARAKALAEGTGLSVSDLVRLLLQLPAAMPTPKHIPGHTSCAGVYRYLAKNGRALARDFLNIDAPQEEGFGWAAVMDETRHAYRNETLAASRRGRA